MFAIIFSVILILAGIAAGRIIPVVRDEEPGKKFTPWPLLPAVAISMALLQILLNRLRSIWHSKNVSCWKNHQVKEPSQSDLPTKKK